MNLCLFRNYGSLRNHFQDKHYLCLTDNCVNEQFTHAFRTELDLKAHRLEKHSVSKAEARLEVDVTFNRPVNQRRNYKHNHHEDQHIVESKPEAKTEKVPDLAQDFPSLSGGAASGVSANSKGSGAPDSLAKKLAISSGRNVQASWATTTNSNGPDLEEDFPSLPGASPMSLAPPKNSKPMNFHEKSANRGKKPTQDPSTKNPRPSSQADYPELPSSNATIHAFGGGGPTRNPAGYKPAWSSTQQQSDNKENDKKSNGSNPPSKRKNVAPAPDLDFPAFPALDAPSGPLHKPQPKSKHKTSNSRPSMERNSAVKAPSKPSNSTSASLASAADLIFSDKPKQQPSKKSLLTEDMVEAERSVKGVRNDGYAQSNVNPSINLVTSLPTREPSPGFQSGKSKNYHKPKPLSKQNYISPPDFNDRNTKLMGTISTAFGGGKSMEFSNFKSCSNQFRSGQLKATGYLEECSELLDSVDKFDDFMPEMIALLPNIHKQMVRKKP